MTVVTTASWGSVPASFIAIAHAIVIDEQGAVGIAVVGHAGIGPQLDDLGAGHLRVKGPAIDVDVPPVG